MRVVRVVRVVTVTILGTLGITVKAVTEITLVPVLGYFRTIFRCNTLLVAFFKYSIVTCLVTVSEPEASRQKIVDS